MINDNLLSLSYGRIISRDMTSSDGLIPESYEIYQIVDPGDIVFRFTDLQNDKRSLRSAIVPERGIITSAYLAAQPKANMIPAYANYLMRSYDNSKVFYGLGGGVRQSLKFADVSPLPLPLPPLDEQQAIADYLDRETQQIDELIAEQRGLIKLLRERRVAVISKTVTSGLRNNLEMINTHNIWIQKIPSDWVLTRFRYVGYVDGTLVDPRDTAGRSQTLIAPNHIQSNTGKLIKLASAESQGADSSKYTVRRGQLLYSKIRPTLNKAVIAPYDCLCSADMYPLSLDEKKVDPSFALFQFLARPIHDYVTERSMRVKMPKINRDELSDAPWVLPPLAEQKKLSKLVTSQTSRIDALISESEDLIALSQERRAALITAAVTGQIDVRKA